MKTSHLLGASAFAAVLAASAVASAAVTIYQQTGVVTSGNCGGLTSSLAVGAPSNSVIYYAGPNIASRGLTLISPGTAQPSTTATGSATTNTCVLQTPTGKALPGSTWVFACFTDTLTSHNPSAVLVVDVSNTTATPVAGHGSITTTNNANAYTVQTVNSLYAGPPSASTLLCSFATNGTWALK